MAHLQRPSALTLALLAGLPTLAAPPKRPNILFILVDDMGYGDLGSNTQNQRRAEGLPALHTPHLDRMAGEGVRFLQHCAAAPVSAPSRASLLTGRHQGHEGVRDNAFDRALEDRPTLGSVLRQAGYATAAIGKWGLQGPGAPQEQPGHPLKRGFDYFFGPIAHLGGHFHYPKHITSKDDQGRPIGVLENFQDITQTLDKAYSTDLFAARAKAWITERARTAPTQPFFLYLAFTAPHARLEVPTMAYPAGGGLNGGLVYTGQPGAMVNTASGTPDTWIHPDYAQATWDHDGDPATPPVPWPEAERRHATMVRRVDDAVGDLLQTLKDLDLDQDTLVVFTSDNGPHDEPGNGGRFRQDPSFFRSYGPFSGIKRDCLEGGLRVPTLVRWPAGAPGGRVEARSSTFVDWLPTLADLAGIPAPAHADGVSLKPTLLGDGPQAASTLYTEYAVSGRTPALADFAPQHRNRPRKQMQRIELEGYVGLRTDITSAEADFEIYDVQKDPLQTRNLAPAMKGLQARMKARVLQLRRPGGGAVRPYDQAPVPALEKAPPTRPGLWQSTYPGRFAWVPDVRGLKPAATQAVSAPSAGATVPGAIHWSGYVRIPRDGTYTFHFQGSGQTFLRLHDARLLEAQGSTRIPLQAGLHPFQATWLPGQAAPVWRLEWEAEGLPRQAVPASAWRRSR